MEEYRGRQRPVLIVAPSGQDARLSRQREMLAGSFEGLRERDVVLIELVGSQVDTVIGPECSQSAKGLRARYSLALDGFSILLVGKDGGVKLRSDEPVSVDALLALIDAMPMRQREMREAKQR
jgi:Domain of unknown function (DUF4174)